VKRGSKGTPTNKGKALENKTNLINQIFANSPHYVTLEARILCTSTHTDSLKSILKIQTESSTERESLAKSHETITTALYYVCLHNHTHKGAQRQQPTLGQNLFQAQATCSYSTRFNLGALLFEQQHKKQAESREREAEAEACLYTANIKIFLAGLLFAPLHTRDGIRKHSFSLRHPLSF
jgi:hypothetical protein